MNDGSDHRTRRRSGCKCDHERGIEGRPVCGTPDARSEAAEGEGGPQGPPYFTSSRNTVDKGEEDLVEIETEYECVAVGCRSRFCQRCCIGLGLQLREVLIPILQTFQSMMMLTLTIDPKLFPSPEHAYRYARKKRCVAELVRALYKAKLLRSRRFFYVVEWQKNTEMAHFHLLVEADFIPFQLLADLWGRFRPKGAPPRQGNEPEFGHVHFSAPKFVSAEHAAHYACKYLTKLPEQGFPEWVRKFEGQIRMFATSRGLLPQRPRSTEIDKPFEPTVQRFAGPPHQDTCFCEVCRGEVAPQPERKKGKTIEERLQKCGIKAAILAVPQYMKADGEIIEGKRYFFAPVVVGFEQVKEVLQVDQQQLRRFRLREGELGRLNRLASQIRDPAEVVAPRLLGRFTRRRDFVVSVA